MQVGIVDPSTGNVTTVGPYYEGVGLAEELASIDTKRNLVSTKNVRIEHRAHYLKIYTIGYFFNTTESFLFALDLKTGQIHSSTKLSVQQPGFVGVGELVAVEPKSGDVLVGGQTDVSTSTHCIQIKTRLYYIEDIWRY